MPTDIEMNDGWTNPNPELWLRTYRDSGGRKLGKHVLMTSKTGPGWIVGFELPGRNIKWRGTYDNADDAMFDAYREAHRMDILNR